MRAAPGLLALDSNAHLPVQQVYVFTSKAEELAAPQAGERAEPSPTRQHFLWRARRSIGPTRFGAAASNPGWIGSPIAAMLWQMFPPDPGRRLRAGAAGVEC